MNDKFTGIWGTEDKDVLNSSAGLQCIASLVRANDSKVEERTNPRSGMFDSLTVRELSRRPGNCSVSTPRVNKTKDGGKQMLSCRPFGQPDELIWKFWIGGQR